MCNLLLLVLLTLTHTVHLIYFSTMPLLLLKYDLRVFFYNSVCANVLLDVHCNYDAFLIHQASVVKSKYYSLVQLDCCHQHYLKRL